jgi:hypothetical protein
LPPGEPGGGITGVVPFRGGVTVIPGSTLGGVMVPFCCDNRSLMRPSGGAILSGGVVGAPGGGTTGTVGFVEDADCASTDPAASRKVVSERVRSIGDIFRVVYFGIEFASGSHCPALGAPCGERGLSLTHPLA